VGFGGRWRAQTYDPLIESPLARLRRCLPRTATAREERRNRASALSGTGHLSALALVHPRSPKGNSGRRREGQPRGVVDGDVQVFPAGAAPAALPWLSPVMQWSMRPSFLMAVRFNSPGCSRPQRMIPGLGSSSLRRLSPTRRTTSPTVEAARPCSPAMAGPDRHWRGSASTYAVCWGGRRLGLQSGLAGRSRGPWRPSAAKRSRHLQTVLAVSPVAMATAPTD